MAREDAHPRDVAVPEDAVRARTTIDAPDGGACANDTIIGLELVHGAELDPLADNTGKKCHYTYCEPLKPKRVARPVCREPLPMLDTLCIAPPEQGTKLPARAPYQKHSCGESVDGVVPPLPRRARRVAA